MSEFEGEDRRQHEYSNIQHPAWLKPEFLLTYGLTVATTLVIVTVYLINADSANAQEIEKVKIEVKHVKEDQEKNSERVEKAVDGIKDTIDKIDEKIDRIIDRRLSANGN